MAATLGSNILLSDKLTRQFKPLVDAMRAAGGTGGTDGMDGVNFRDSHPHHHAVSGDGSSGFDLGSFDLGSLDLGGLDLGALGSAIESFDSGFSDGGGGHDGGGGGHH